MRVAMKPGTIFASNTSTLPITSLAENFSAPADFVGIHFFSPVERMMLVEVIKGAKTGDRALAAAFDYNAKIKKTPIVVKDVRGFFTNRVFPPYMGEAMKLVTEGVKPALIEKYKAKAMSLPAGDAPAFRAEGDHQVRQIQNHPTYAAMVENLDTNIGRIMDRLASLGLDKTTILIFTSDNGGLSIAEGSPTSNAPLRAGKGWAYEGGVREPLLVKWPGITKPGSVCNEPVTSTDFFPTLLEMAGLQAHSAPDSDGTSRVFELQGQTSPPRPLFWHYPHYSNQGGKPYGAVRLGDFKLIEWYEDKRVELYNLRNDLGEKNNLATDNPETVAALASRLNNWRHDIKALMPESNPSYDPTNLTISK
jgi:arylsulfatase A-like enzyme